MTRALIQIMAEAQGSLSVLSTIFSPNKNSGLAEGVAVIKKSTATRRLLIKNICIYCFACVVESAGWAVTEIRAHL